MSSSGFHCFFTVITGFYWVLLGFSGFYCFFLGCIGFYWVFTGFLLGFYWVLLGFTLISSLIVVSIGLHLGLPERERISMRTQISQTVFRTSLQPRWWRSLLKSWSDYFRWWSSFSFRITLRLFACSEDDPNSTNRKFRRRNIKKQRQNRVRFFVRLHFLIRPLSLSFPSPVFFYIFRFFWYFFRSASECLPSFNEPSPVGAFLWVPRIEYHNLSSGLFFFIIPFDFHWIFS